MDTGSCPTPPTKQRLSLYTSPCNHGDATALSLPSVISVLASLLDRHISRNDERRVSTGRREPDALPSVDARARAFDSDTVLDMSTGAFLGRFSRYAHVSPQVHVVAYVYLDRLCRGSGATGVRVAATNVQLLLTTAVLVASKFVEDVNYKNSYFAAVGGLSTAELNSLEIDFLFLLQFKLNVSESVFRSYCRRLERELIVNHGGGHRVERCLKAAASIYSGEVSSREAQQRRKQQQASNYTVMSLLEFVNTLPHQSIKPSTVLI